MIEVSKESRNKFASNAEDHIFELKKVLPSGMAFPYDFGFVPTLTGSDRPLQRRPFATQVPIADRAISGRLRDVRLQSLRALCRCDRSCQ
jgi:inorganic pyrophosphatase